MTDDDFFVEPADDWSDEKLFEWARQLVHDRMDQALRAIERGCSVAEMLEDQGLPIETKRVIAADIRELGRVDYLHTRQWIYRDRAQPRIFYVISLQNRILLRARGYCVIEALVNDTNPGELTP
jgi:hypothetical protein